MQQVKAGRRVRANRFAVRSLVTAITATLLTAPAFAQHAGASVDAGVLNMQYADSVDANAIALTPSLWLESRSGIVSTTGTFSHFTGGGWSAQGAAGASLFTPRIGYLLGEIEGSAGGSTRDDASRTGQLLAIARAHVSSDSYGLWVGGGAGRTWDGFIWRSLQQGEAAAWGRFGNTSASISASPVIVDDSIRYTDAQISAAINLPRVDLNASAGFRGGSRLPTLGGTAKSWGSVSLTGWMMSRVAVVASAGTYPVDLTQGFPGGRFASVGIRLGSRRFQPASIAAVEITPRKNFEVRSVNSRTRELRVRAPSANSVEVMGDFTSWRSVSLRTADDGWWSIQLPISSGIHEVNVRINGGAWTVPQGLPRKSDEFGGSVGVLVIPM
jgi:hypothetical protein